ncbi:MAG: 2,3-dihydroxyphenylpropionate 1,2-dioxygenase [Alphaproteobacteria bacterium]|nr:2,3-dihydroxyphenylpropionate 1,2-dioxygenase [Alphaproteobacteria bacterium]
MQIAGMVSMAHSPSWNLQPQDGPPRPYIEAVFRTRDIVARVKPDLLVVFGPDHVRNFFFDLMPTFCIGVEQVTAFGDYDSPGGDLPNSPEIAHFIADHVMRDGFDPALSYNMGVDHGISQPVAALVPDLSVPVVPIVVNAAGPPLPTLARCHAFGRSVGAAIRAFPGAGRALIVGSGGMSHWPPAVSPDSPEVSAETRDYLINGRPRVHAFNAEREASSRLRRAEARTGPINEAWDHWFLECLRNDRIEDIIALDNADLLEAAGPGGQELRAWLAALGAWDGPITNIDYCPVPTWITGMGCISAFETETA